ncbi:hypothetical protein EVAR_47876_1 [Eumeta japonica]|uniref:Uncharacterized protein n=1 Tax=Eumeta variegata TaxID=151549 RepID=A0A4C1ZYN0_EUMVA|nr:hypothetical protein EVAR_47876_1 [Eumeta japonica]
MTKNIKHDASAIWDHLELVLYTIKELVPLVTIINFSSDSPSDSLAMWPLSKASFKFSSKTSAMFNVIAEDDISKKVFPNPKRIPIFKGTEKVHQAIWSSSFPFNMAMRSLSCFTCRDSFVQCKNGRHFSVLNVGLYQGSTLQSATGYNKNDLVMGIIDSSDGTIDEICAEFLNKQDSNVQTGFDYNNNILVLESIDFLTDGIIDAQYKPLDGEDAIVQSQPDYNIDGVGMRSTNSLNDTTIEAVHKPLDDNSLIYIDTPPIFNNIEDLRQFDLVTKTLHSDNADNKPIKILSNIRVNYQRFRAHCPDTRGFSSIAQTEFVKFTKVQFSKISKIISRS